MPGPVSESGSGPSDAIPRIPKWALPTLEEMIADRDATKRDICNLSNIRNCLRDFINHAHGEDRTLFKMDLFKYETLYKQGAELLDRINEHIDAEKEADMTSHTGMTADERDNLG